MTAISQVVKRHPSGLVDYQVRIYLGFLGNEKVLRVSCKTDELIPRRWRLSAAKSGSFWELRLNRIKPGTALFFRLELNDGRSIPFVPLGESDVVNGVVRVPDYHPSWLQPRAVTTNKAASEPSMGMAILLEQTLEGLLADYEQGVYFTDAIEELLAWSVADRILQTKIPETVRDLGYTEIMFPLFASVADRCNLDPKFNYLVYNLSADWQLGTASDIRSLVHRFRECGIELVPDLVFVHQVKNPYPGSSDDVSMLTEISSPFEDSDPFLFRDYGTWHFKLEDPIIREIIIDKILETILTLDFHVLRVDYIDGLLMQSANRATNHGALLLHELRQGLQRVCPEVRIIGEAFQTAGDPAVRSLIDSIYSPRGVSLLDLLLTSVPDRAIATRDAVDGLTKLITAFNDQSQAESNYSQLHDECWCDHWISRGRPHTPWAYGAMPMGLTLKRIDSLIEDSWIERTHRMETAVALTLLIRTLGLALSFSRWMETSGCLSLDQGSLDDPLHWQFPWSPTGAHSRRLFPASGLSEDQRRDLISGARAHVAAANHLFRRLGRSERSPLGVPLRMVHGDIQSGLAAFVRWGRDHPNPALVLVNLSPVEAADQAAYEIDLSSAGWKKENNPDCLKAHTPPILAKTNTPVLLTQSRGSASRYQLNRPLQGYESIVFEVPLHDR